jgi:hypothetical protein
MSTGGTDHRHIDTAGAQIVGVHGDREPHERRDTRVRTTRNHISIDVDRPRLPFGSILTRSDLTKDGRMVWEHHEMSVIDHLVYAVPELAEAIDRFERATGVRPAYGGAHPGMGTHNALVSFGNSYLELIAPDPEQPDPGRPRPFGIDDLADESRLVTFAVHPIAGESIDGLVAAARAVGHDPGEPIPMSRLRPDGVELRWRLTFPTHPTGDGLIPFVIDWGDTENPARSAPGDVELGAIRWTHPNAEPVARARTALGFTDVVEPATAAMIEVTLSGAAGELTL